MHRSGLRRSLPSTTRRRSRIFAAPDLTSPELFGKRGDRAMVIVAHQTDLIRAHCDHAAILEQGRLTVYESVDAAIHAYENL
ncbi:capsule polysaccharide exporter, ATP-binding protein [Burkholderiales bacterium GJ-E10]|nr:capsule polysaccharide exporter, ATP-binding protein [Burkholderiales bacterium GJ-E10]